jgi:phosphatidylglycerophosphate synthase
MVVTLVGFVLLGFGQDVPMRVYGWIGFFVWAVLDCVDGNVARCKGLASERGALWDATGGYMALSLIFFAVGIAAYNDNNVIELLDKHLYIVLGGLASLMSLFPRLVMQKKKADSKNNDVVKSVGDKANYNMSKIIALNVESAIGFMQVILLLSIIFHFLNLFILTYFFINFVIMIYSLYTLLK